MARRFRLCWQTVVQQLEPIYVRRSAIDGFTLALGDALAYYTGMNSRFLGLISELSKVSPDENIAIMTAAYANFLQSKERAGIERAVLLNTFVRDGFGERMFHRFLNLPTTQDNSMNVFLSLASDEHKQFYADTLKGEAVNETTRMRRLANRPTSPRSPII